MLHHFCFEKPVASPAVYAFVSPDRRTVYYIGQSANVVERFRAHAVKRYLKKCSIPFEFCWKVFPEDDLTKAEKIYILRYKPVLNTFHNFDAVSDLKASYALYASRSSQEFSAGLTTEEVLLPDILSTLVPKSLQGYCELGKAFIQIRDVLSRARLAAPLKTNMGYFVSFNNFLDKNALNRTSVYRYIRLAEGWDVAVKLDLLNTLDDKYNNSTQFCTALKVIEWYKKKVKAGVDPETLTLKLYWAEQALGVEKKASQPYDELLRERDYYKERCQILEEQLAATLT